MSEVLDDPQPPLSEAGLQRWALGVEYHGGAFNGWQTQPHGNTVQDVLEAVLAEMAGHPIATVCAGRTDAGVHAVGQVVHFDTSAQRPEQAWVRGVNTHLPATVRVHWARNVPRSFHARFGAQWRAYRYWLQLGPTRSAMLAELSTWVHHPLNLAAMQEAAQVLVGEHDFSTFRAAECQAANPVRTMHAISVSTQFACGVQLVQIDLRANAFLQHMVRNIVGALVQVGRGRLDTPGLAQMLAARDRRMGAATLAPHGLCLSEVAYPAAFGLPLSCADR